MKYLAILTIPIVQLHPIRKTILMWNKLNLQGIQFCYGTEISFAKLKKIKTTI